MYCLCLYTVSSYAGVLVEPVQLYIHDTKRQRSTTLALTSTDTNQKRIFEAHVFKWTQDENGENILTPDTTLMINPKNFIMQAKQTQSIRIGFKQPIDTIVPNGQEGTWRIILNELPQEATEGAKVGFLLNFNMPLFVGQQHDLKLDIQYKNSQINIKNLSNSHVQISHFELIDQNKNVVYSNNEMRYLLAQKAGNYTLKSALNDPKKYSVRLMTDKNTEKQTFPLSQ
ncbi:molecular chaperone [Acinetobacter sp. MD2(2019)]|nr:molecular chaperone [Acinetobacter sp. MD2(2019)]